MEDERTGDSLLSVYEANNNATIETQQRIIERLNEQNDQMQQVCNDAEAKLKQADKWMRLRLATLAETKQNFAYIFKKIRYLQACEEMVAQKLANLDQKGQVAASAMLDGKEEDDGEKVELDQSDDEQDVYDFDNSKLQMSAAGHSDVVKNAIS